MPELPDVEVYRRHLAATSLQRKIRRVRVEDTTVLRGTTRPALARALEGHALKQIRRHGKYLFAAGSGRGWLAMHFGMTGRLEHADRDGGRAAHARLALEFADRTRLVYVDQRRLGHVSLIRDPSELVEAERLGPDALALPFVDFRDLLRHRRGTVKAALMNQEVVAGIGNIYSDEILFQARVDPTAQSAALDEAGCRRLYRQVGRVLSLAADRGAEPARLPHTWLLPHREDGAPCPRGNGTVRKFRTSGRGAFYCPACQGS